jgi:hypothetical protein
VTGIKKPAVIGDGGLFGAQEGLASFQDAVPSRFSDKKKRVTRVSRRFQP